MVINALKPFRWDEWKIWLIQSAVLEKEKEERLNTLRSFWIVLSLRSVVQKAFSSSVLSIRFPRYIGCFSRFVWDFQWLLARVKRLKEIIAKFRKRLGDALHCLSVFSTALSF